MALPSIFIGHPLVNWLDRDSFFYVCLMYPLLRTEDCPDPVTSFPFFPGSVVSLCETALPLVPEREQATPREAAPVPLLLSCSLSRSGAFSNSGALSPYDMRTRGHRTPPRSTTSAPGGPGKRASSPTACGPQPSSAFATVPRPPRLEA